MDFDYRSPYCFSISDHFPARLCKRMVFIDSCNGFREIAIPILLPRVHVGITGITDRMVGTAQATRFYDPFTIAASSLRDIFNRYSFFSLPKENSRNRNPTCGSTNHILPHEERFPALRIFPSTDRSRELVIDEFVGRSEGIVGKEIGAETVNTPYLVSR